MICVAGLQTGLRLVLRQDAGAREQLQGVLRVAQLVLELRAQETQSRLIALGARLAARVRRRLRSSCKYNVRYSDMREESGRINRSYIRPGKGEEPATRTENDRVEGLEVARGHLEVAQV